MSRADETIDESKRLFTKGLVATGLAGFAASCTPPRLPGIPTSLIEPLEASGLTFINSEGEPVNLRALQAKLAGHPTTLSFQFAACGDVCPVTGISLGRVSRDYPNTRHIVIATVPQHDFGVLESRLQTGYMRRYDDTSPVDYTGLVTQGHDQNTIVLYPSTNNRVPSITDVDTAPELAERIGTLQQQYFNLPTGTDPLTQHSGTVLVYNGQGNLAGQIDNYGSIVSELPGILDGINQEEQLAR